MPPMVAEVSDRSLPEQTGELLPTGVGAEGVTLTVTTKVPVPLVAHPGTVTNNE